MAVFFFKQNTEYGLRISDWSSELWSADLMITRTAASASSRSSAASSARQVGTSMSFRVSGRFTVIRPIGPSTSTRTGASLMGVFLSSGHIGAAGGVHGGPSRQRPPHGGEHVVGARQVGLLQGAGERHRHERGADPDDRRVQLVETDIGHAGGDLGADAERRSEEH